MLTNTSGAPHKVRRAIAQRYFSGPAAKKHQNVQEAEAHELLRALVASPDDLHNHLNRFVAPHILIFAFHFISTSRFAANVILLGTYGYRIPESSDPLFAKIEETLVLQWESFGVLEFLLNAFPICL